MGTRIWGLKNHKGMCNWTVYKMSGKICKQCKEKTGGNVYYAKVKFRCMVAGCDRFEVRKHVHV